MQNNAAANFGAPLPPPTRIDVTENKYTKTKRAVFIGIFMVLCVIGWHIYENIFHRPSEQEVTDIMALSQKLYDIEQLHNPYLAKVNFQKHYNSHLREDQAKESLLTVQNDRIAADKTSTTFLLKRLFDNYELNTLTVENVTPEEEQEEMDFLHAVMKTPIMKRAMNFMHMKGAVSSDYNTQLQLLKDLWFTQYSRGGGRVGSSGFEHVFLAELKSQKVLGLHNWLYFAEQEQTGLVDYQGFLERQDLGKDNQHLAAVRVTFHDITKPYNVLLIGTSPELELSLYTVCFVLSLGDSCPVQLGSVKFNIMTHDWMWHGKKIIAAAYPAIEK